MAPLANKKVLVVGGTSGIGFAVAKAAHAEGAIVTVASSSPAKVSNAVERLGGGDRVKGEVVDLNKEETVKTLFEKVGKVDHLVFTAGDSSGFEELVNSMSGKAGLDPDTIVFPYTNLQAVPARMQVRYFGMLACAKLAKEYVTDSFTTTTGTIAKRPMPGWAVGQSVATAGNGAALGLALDLAPIRVNVVAPGAVKTELFDIIPEEMQKGMFDSLAQKLPVGRVGLPEEVAEAYLFMMKCTYVTGQILYVDGGQLLK